MAVTSDGTPYVEPGDAISAYPVVSQELAAVIDSLRQMIPAGAIFPYAGKTAPEGYLMCDGKAYNRADFYELYEVMADWVGQWGGWPSGNSTRFFVPDFRGRAPWGVNPSMDDVLMDVGLGQRAGDRKPPYHVHLAPGENLPTLYQSGGSPAQGWNAPGDFSNSTFTSPAYDQSAQPHNGLSQMLPYTGVNFIVYTATTTAGKSTTGEQLPLVTTRQMIEARLEEAGIGEEEIKMLREQLKELETADG